MHFRVLGPVAVEQDGRSIPLRGSRERCILGVLVLAAGRPVTVDRLIELLWADERPPGARAAVHTYVSRLRRALTPQPTGGHPALIAREANGYLIDIDPDAVDARRFQNLVDRARASPGLAERSRLLTEALALWRGSAFANVEPPALRERLARHLDQLRLSALRLRVETDLALGRHREIVDELTALVAEYPLDEVLARQLMLALYRGGRRPDALGVYHRTRHRIAGELGLDPGTELQQLHAAILRGDPVGLEHETGTHPESGRAAANRLRPAQLPAPPAAFSGRDEQLNRLNEFLRSPGTPDVNVIVISGTAGVGKTALAVHWAHRVARRFPDGQLFVNLRGFDPGGTALRPSEVIRLFLDAMDVPVGRIPADLDAQIGLFRSLLALRRMLVVLDNAGDAAQVRPLLPGSTTCLTLVTSRDKLAGLVATTGATSVSLDLLTTGEARQLLGRRIGAHRVAAEPDSTNEVIARCARLPLALAIVAARAATSPELGLSELAAELGTAHGLDALTGADTATDLRSVFSWSYRILSPPAARLFRLLGLHPGADISAAAAASLAGVVPAETSGLLGELTRAHLLAEPAPGRFALHDLLRAYAAERAQDTDSDADRDTAVRRLLDHYLHTGYAAAMLVEPHRARFSLEPAQPGVSPEQLSEQDRALGWFVSEHSVLLAATHLAANNSDRHAIGLAWAVTDHLQRRGHWSDLVTVHGLAVAAADRLDDRPAQARAHRHLGRANTLLKRHGEAQTHYRHALDLCRQLGDLEGEAHTYFNLANDSEIRGRIHEARDHALRALELFRAAGAKVGQARLLNSVGWFYTLTGDHRQALAHCGQALAMLEELGDRTGQAYTIDSIGYAHLQLGQCQQAIDCFRRCRELFQELGDEVYEAASLHHLGNAHLAAGDPDSAGDAWRAALDLMDPLGHPEANEVHAKLSKLSS